MKGDKSLKAALVQQRRTAPDMSEEVKREANENIQIHDAFQAQEQESKEKEAKVKGDLSLKAALVQQRRTAPDISQEMKGEESENIQIHDAITTQEYEGETDAATAAAKVRLAKGLAEQVVGTEGQHQAHGSPEACWEAERQFLATCCFQED